MQNILVTEYFSISPSDYLRCLAGIWLKRYGIFFAIPFLAAVALSAVDIRFIIVALMIVFLIIPLMMPLWYYYYMLSPEAASTVLTKKVTVVSDHHLQIQFEPPAEDEPWKPRADQRVEWSEIVRVFRFRGFLVYLLRRPRIQFIMIPFRCLKVNSETL